MGILVNGNNARATFYFSSLKNIGNNPWLDRNHTAKRENLPSHCFTFDRLSLVKLIFVFRADLVGSYGLGGDELAEELEDACADIQDLTTLEADNYEDQLPQPEVNSFSWSVFFFRISLKFLLVCVFMQVDELTAINSYSKLKFIDYFGTDKHGQHIFAIYACRLPPRQDLNGNFFIE